MGKGSLRNAESYQGVICGKFVADFFCGMKGKVWNESMQNITKMNISETRCKLETHKHNIIDNM